MSNLIRYYHEMKAYRLAFSLQQQVFTCSRGWPPGEVHALTAAWARRADPAEFVSRLTLVDAELAEATHWLETARSCGYLKEAEYRQLKSDMSALGRMLAAMASASQKLAAMEPRPAKAVPAAAGPS